MPMVRYGRRPSATTVWQGTTVALVPDAPSGAVVVSLHGWPNGFDANVTLGALVQSQRAGVGYPVDALLAVGTTIFYPFLGPSWGTEASSEQAYLDVVTLVGALGLSVSTIGIIGGSMGGLNAISFARQDGLEDVPIVLYVPAIDLGATWDVGGTLRTSIEDVWGVGRSTVLANAADIDPVQTDCSFLHGRTTVIAATNDVLVPYAGVAAWCAQWDLPLITTTSGHFSLDDPAVDEVALLAAVTP